MSHYHNTDRLGQRLNRLRGPPSEFAYIPKAANQLFQLMSLFQYLVALHPDKRVKLLIKCLVHVDNIRDVFKVVNFHRNL